MKIAKIDALIKYKNMIFFPGQNLGRGLTRNTSYLIYFLLSIIVLAYIIPTFVFLSPSGTDVYTHMFNTLRTVDSNSLFEFYEKSFREEYLGYDYPFGLWFFGSIIMKVTGMEVDELVYILPLILAIVSVFIYYIYAHRLLLSKNKAILAAIFLVSMPIIVIGMLNYSTGRFVPVLLIPIIYLSINKPNLSSVFITGLLVFPLVFTHTGTYMFLMFFSIAYFILSALIWKKFDAGMYALIVSLLVLYVMAVQLFPYVQPHYIDKGRMVLDISESISSKLGLEFVKEMGRIFYDRIFVANNLIYVFFWSCLVFAAGKFSLFIHSKVESLYYRNLLAIPVIGSIKNVSHAITTTPFWVGPVHTLVSIFGIFKLNKKGKCIALSLVLTSLFPGALQSEGGTGSLREIYYLYLIVPISSAAGFYYIIQIFKKYSTNKIKKFFIAIFFLVLILPLISAPIIGSMYYQPTISGTKSEKENLIWLSKIGSSIEGVSGFAYRERIDLYANKFTPSIPSGSEMKRYLNDLRNIYFSGEAEEYAKDLYSFNIKYILSSDRTLKEFGVSKDSLNIDSNKQLDKIYSSVKNFGIYRYIPPPAILKNSSSEKFGLEFEKAAPKIQDFGSTYLVENDFYKVKLSETTPEVKYIGTKTRNLLGEGNFYDYITISWQSWEKSEYEYKNVGYYLNELKYPYISIKDNTITYETVVRDGQNSENWATLFVKYTFYEKAVKREILVAHDWVGLDRNLQMNLEISSSFFAPAINFEFIQIGYDENKARAKKIFPSMDSVVLKDRKFREIYLNENDIGLYIWYGDSAPYPTRIIYKGSTIYEYSDISMDSIFSLSPSESVNMIQYFSVGDETTAKSNIEYHTSVSPYMYPEAKIPVILAGYTADQKDNKDSSNAYKKLQDYNVTYNEGITQRNKVFFVPPPIFEFFREGLRNPKIAYYHGEESGPILIPVTGPPSSLLRPDYEVENVFSQWKETLDSVVDDGGMAVFQWNLKDIGNPAYIDKVMELINYSKSKGMSFTTPDEIVDHFKLLQKIYTNATKGVDYVIINASNHNQEEIKGITYRLEMPVINNSCPYYAINGRIPRQEITEGNCKVYVSFDLEAEEQKDVTVEPNITRKIFELDFSNVYEGNNIILVRDDKGNPIDKAIAYVDASKFESNQKGEVEFLIRRGIHKIRIEKPGFVSGDYEIEVKGRVYKLFDHFK